MVVGFTERPALLPLYLPSDSVDSNTFVQLTCIVTAGDLPINFDWLFNGNPIGNVGGSVDGSLSVSRVSPQTSLLILSAVSLHQAGNYTCHVTNAAGYSSSSIQVKVNGKKHNWDSPAVRNPFPTTSKSVI